MALLWAPWAIGSDVPAASCPPDPMALSAAPAAPPRDRGLLWEVRRDGRTSWVYGTLHIGRPEWGPPGPAVQAALAASDVVAMEIDLFDPAVPSALAGGPAAADRLPPPLRQRLTQAVKSRCLPLDMVLAQPPMAQLLAIAGAEMQRDGFHALFGSEFVLGLVARAAGKPVRGLETVQEQMAALQPDSAQDEEELVAGGLDDLHNGRMLAVLRKTVAVWERGDEAALADYAGWCECLRTPAERRLFDRIGKSRDGILAQRLVALHAQGKSFFGAVGALHLVEPNGIVAILRRQGFDVRRVRFAS